MREALTRVLMSHIDERSIIKKLLSQISRMYVHKIPGVSVQSISYRAWIDTTTGAIRSDPIACHPISMCNFRNRYFRTRSACDVPTEAARMSRTHSFHTMLSVRTTRKLTLKIHHLQLARTPDPEFPEVKIDKPRSFDSRTRGIERKSLVDDGFDIMRAIRTELPRGNNFVYFEFGLPGELA